MGTVTIVRPDAETTDDLEEISLGKGGKVVEKGVAHIALHGCISARLSLGEASRR